MPERQRYPRRFVCLCVESCRCLACQDEWVRRHHEAERQQQEAALFGGWLAWTVNERIAS